MFGVYSQIVYLCTRKHYNPNTNSNANLNANLGTKILKIRQSAKKYGKN